MSTFPCDGRKNEKKKPIIAALVRMRNQLDIKPRVKLTYVRESAFLYYCCGS